MVSLSQQANLQEEVGKKNKTVLVLQYEHVALSL